MFVNGFHWKPESAGKKLEYIKKRWISLIAAFLIEVTLGFGDAFSLTLLPLSAEHGWSLSLLSIAFSISSATIIITSPTFLPFLSKRMSSAKVVLCGAAFYAYIHRKTSKNIAPCAATAKGCVVHTAVYGL